jgi:hypothetical protein
MTNVCEIPCSPLYLDISGKSRRTEEPVVSFQILQPKLHEFGNFHQVNPTLKGS